MDKYYIPTLEEFHVGFEYEVYVPQKDIWSKEIFYLNTSHINLVKYVNLQDVFTIPIRVKYLDEEDIESFGFVKYNIKNITVYIRTNINLYWFNDSYLSIDKGDTQYFRGNIKNKSELKRILTQIGYD